MRNQWGHADPAHLPRTREQLPPKFHRVRAHIRAVFLASVVGLEHSRPPDP